MIVFCKIGLFCKIWKQKKKMTYKIQDMTKNIFCHKKKKMASLCKFLLVLCNIYACIKLCFGNNNQTIYKMMFWKDSKINHV